MEKVFLSERKIASMSFSKTRFSWNFPLARHNFGKSQRGWSFENIFVANRIAFPMNQEFIAVIVEQQYRQDAIERFVLDEPSTVDNEMEAKLRHCIETCTWPEKESQLHENVTAAAKKKVAVESLREEKEPRKRSGIDRMFVSDNELLVCVVYRSSLVTISIERCRLGFQ